MIKVFPITLRNIVNLHRLYSTSKLYIPYNQTSETYVIVEPFVDLENQLKNINALKHNVRLRGLNINVENIHEKWPSFQHIRNNIVRLNLEKQNLTEKLKTKKYNETEIKQIIESRRSISTELQQLREQISVLEKELVIPSLSIPNNLHPDCPVVETRILQQYDGKSNFNANKLNHIDIGNALGCLDYKNSVMVYLMNEAALFEIATLTYFKDSLESLDFIPLCNSDMVKSLIIEGCGLDYTNHDATLKLSEQNLHLVGGASLQSFCALLTKQIIAGNKLPLKLYASGRSYKLPNNSIGLFSTVQTNAVNLLIGSVDEHQSKDQFDKMISIYKMLYDEIGLNYRIIYLPVSKLDNWECLRAQIEVYSINSQEYQPVGTLSLSDSYISKRLRMYYSGKDKKNNFLHILNGKIVDTNVLLGCLLEYDVKQLHVPNCIKKHMIL
ncbi:uncharacterized protein LOC126839251 [Adelges cooleyi]|uniref:uncharacterized protein LOC126839251 n=1 Tax=Adelges cooleyi TaxID=133065 RepID=UPI00218086D5|nr:uncharacterized protein LOC126839251 [Adelges cooleyi]